jgi:hypothetical protein
MFLGNSLDVLGKVSISAAKPEREVEMVKEKNSAEGFFFSSLRCN